MKTEAVTDMKDHPAQPGWETLNGFNNSRNRQKTESEEMTESDVWIISPSEETKKPVCDSSA